MDNTKSLRAYEKAGITMVTHELKTDTYPFQYAKFDSLDEMRRKVYDGYKNKVWDEQAWQELGFVTASDETRKWRFGSEAKNIDQLNHAMEFGAVSEYTLSRIEKIREALFNRDAVKELEYRAATKKKRRVFSECGAELDIDRVMCADPMHWQSLTPGKETNVIKIGFNASTTGQFDEDAFNNIAAYGVVMSELAEMAGYNIEFYGMWIATTPNLYLSFGGAQVKLKSAEFKTDAQALAVAGLPGLFRCYTFFIINQMLDSRHRGGYGSSHGLSAECKELLGFHAIIDQHTTPDKMIVDLNNILNLNN